MFLYIQYVSYKISKSAMDFVNFWLAGWGNGGGVGASTCTQRLYAWMNVPLSNGVTDRIIWDRSLLTCK